ncbi:MAG: hypothetical protein Q7O66_14150 [Dehalococcoidia bacterium]|nr:hypothetical protein [Dehalococcoidia bacterium]
MSESEVIILDPVALPKSASTRLASRPTDLKGITVGYLDNGWWSFGLLIDVVQKRLAERYGVSGAIYLKKNKSSPATKQIEELAEKCQVVINGLGN